MSTPLPKDNRCNKCGEWYHNAHVCPMPAMTANTPEAMDERALPKLTAAYMDACKGKPADHNEIGLHYFMAGWVSGREAMTARANLPLPRGDADKVDAERWRYAIKDDGTGRMNWRTVYEAWDGDGYFVEALDAARLTPGGQP